MFRVSIYKRTELDERPIADIGVVSASVSEDLTQKATSTFVTYDIPDSVSVGDVVRMYDSKGLMCYFGVIGALTENSIECSQFYSIYNDNHLFKAQTTTNQKAFFNAVMPAYIIDFMLKSREVGQESSINTRSATPNFAVTWSGLIDENVKATYKGIEHYISDESDESTFVPYLIASEVGNLEQYIYDMYSTYNRIVRPFLKTFPNSSRVSGIPEGYTQTEYIKFDSIYTSYIPTGLKCAMGYSVEADIVFDRLPLSTYYSFLSSYNGTNYVTYLYIKSTGVCGIRIGATDYASTYTIRAGKRIKLKIDMISGNEGVWVDGVRYLTATKTSTYSFNNMTIGCLYNNGTYTKFLDMTLYRLTIKDASGNLVKDFVPTIDNSTGYAGVYDLVGGTFTAGTKTPENIQAGVLLGKPKIALGIINPVGDVELTDGTKWDYNERTLFDTFKNIDNLEITKEVEDANTVAVYDNDYNLRGTYTLLNDGTIAQITSGTSVENRLGVNKTKIVVNATNTVTSLARANLPVNQHNHNISFDIYFDDDDKLTDYSLGVPIKFFNNATNEMFNSVLSGWKYEINEGDEEVKKASFILGKVRKTLTSKLNRGKVK